MAQNTNQPIEDAIGQWLNPGDVITHANRSGSSCWIDVGVVTAKHEDGSIQWCRVEGIRWGWRGDKAHWAKKTTRLYRTDLCVKLDMTRERLIAKFGLPAETVGPMEDFTTQPSQTFHRPLPAEEFDF